MAKQVKNKQNNEIDVLEIIKEHIRVFDTIDMLCVGINKKIDEINEGYNNDPEINVPLAVVERLITYIVKECNSSLDAMKNAAQTGKYEAIQDIS